MGFLKIVRPPVVQAGESTESVVRRAISRCGGDGDTVRVSDKLRDVLREPDDVFDVVNLLTRSLEARPTSKELSSVETVGELAALFNSHRHRRTSDAG